jgi:hypothetical protein
MANDRDLRRLLRPLLERRPDLGYSRRQVFFQPVTHYLCGAFFIHGSISQYTTVQTFAQQIFNGQDCNWFGFHHDAYEFEFPPTWKDDPDAASIEICDRIEHYGLPPVQQITDPRQHEASRYMPIPERPKAIPNALTRALGACYYGGFDEAERMLLENDQFLEECPLDSVTEEHKYRPQIWGQATYLLWLLRTNPSAVPQLMHEWEAFTVKSLKLTKFWKPTPFPCEI